MSAATTTTHTAELTDWLTAHGFHLTTNSVVWSSYTLGSIRVHVAAGDTLTSVAHGLRWSAEFDRRVPFSVVVAAIKAAMTEAGAA